MSSITAVNFHPSCRMHSTFQCVFPFFFFEGGGSPSSSDDEIKEAFEATAYHLRKLSPPTHYAWGKSAVTHFSPLSSPTSSKFPSSPNQLSTTGSPVATRPHKVVPLGGRHKHKFFAQMPSNFMDRPFLDFNKMQHSKRLVMVSTQSKTSLSEGSIQR